VLSDERSRAHLSPGAKIIAKQPCSQFFNWEDIYNSDFPPSKQCVQDLKSALRCILTGEALPKRLREMKKKKQDFHADVILEGIAAIYKELLDFEEGQFSAVCLQCTLCCLCEANACFFLCGSFFQEKNRPRRVKKK